MGQPLRTAFTLLIGSPLSFEFGYNPLFFLCSEHRLGALLPPLPEVKDCFGTHAQRLHNIPRLHVLSKEVERIGSHIPICDCRASRKFAAACAAYRFPRRQQTVYFRRLENHPDAIVIEHRTLWVQPPFSLQIANCRDAHTQAFRHVLTVHEEVGAHLGTSLVAT